LRTEIFLDIMNLNPNEIMKIVNKTNSNTFFKNIIIFNKILRPNNNIMLTIFMSDVTNVLFLVKRATNKFRDRCSSIYRIFTIIDLPAQIVRYAGILYASKY